jgi:hypothetical protein
MSNDKIPGVPDGWELVRIGVVHHGEWRLMDDGSIRQWLTVEPSIGWAVVIRKIEKPAKYRQFANAEEFLPHADRKISRVGNDGKKIPGFTIATSCSDSGVWLGDIYSDWKEMLDRGHVFLDDGTPFGVRIDE